MLRFARGSPFLIAMLVATLAVMLMPFSSFDRQHDSSVLTIKSNQADASFITVADHAVIQTLDSLAAVPMPSKRPIPERVTRYVLMTPSQDASWKVSIRDTAPTTTAYLTVRHGSGATARS